MSNSKVARRLGDRLGEFADDYRFKLDEEELAVIVECSELLERLAEDFEAEEESEEDIGSADD